jgi:vancomycin aglycone glucosyltransferase
MRVLLSTIGSRGDVQPLLALALELRALGQEARFCVPPDFQAWLAGLGFAVTPIGPELRSMMAAKPSGPPAPMTPEQRKQLAEASVAAQFQTVAAAAEGCDAIVAATALQIAARSVAEVRGIPYAFAAYCPNVLPSPHHAPPPLPPIPGMPVAAPGTNAERWARDGERFDALFGPALDAHRATLGLAPVADVRAHVFGERPWLAADRALAPWPDPADDGVFQPGAWIVADERPLSPEIEAFLAAGAPPIYFGFGSMRAAPDLSHVMSEAARAVGRRAIVSRGWAELALLDAAGDCLAIDEANLQALFARVAAVVHHGGAGTTTIAALAGAPQVVVPQIYDQHYFAQRVRELGIGAAHAPGAPATESLTAARESALAPGVAAAAGALAAKVARDGTRIAAERLMAQQR